MSLQKLKNPTPQAVVQVSDAEGFSVRGLNPADIMALYYRHTGELSGLFEKLAENYKANGDQIVGADVQAVTLSMIRDAPGILAEIIAVASGSNPADDENWAIDVGIALMLPFPVQTDALQAIGNLTFTSAMPVGKFLALVVGALEKTTAAAARFQPA